MFLNYLHGEFIIKTFDYNISTNSHNIDAHETPAYITRFQNKIYHFDLNARMIASRLHDITYQSYANKQIFIRCFSLPSVGKVTHPINFTDIPKNNKTQCTTTAQSPSPRPGLKSFTCSKRAQNSLLAHSPFVFILLFSHTKTSPKKRLSELTIKTVRALL